jgi:hypothetical protein
MDGMDRMDCMDPAGKALRRRRLRCFASRHRKKTRARHLVGPGGIFTYGKVHSVHFVHTVHPVQFVHRFSFSLSSPNP